MDDIILRWSYGQSACPNETGFCYIVDGVHLRLLAQHMKTWSMAINEQEEDIDTMPAALAKTLMPAKLGTKNPLRENAAKPLDMAANHPAAANHLAALPLPSGPMNPHYRLTPPYYNAYTGLYHQLGYPPPLQQANP